MPRGPQKAPTVAERDAAYPHPYEEQRKVERKAEIARKNTLQAGGKLPVVCGFTYMPRKSKRFPDRPLLPRICQRTAGAGTSHFGQGFCDFHAVAVERETSKGRATQDIIQAKAIAYANSSYFGEAEPTDAHTALSNEITRTAGIIKWLESHLTEMRDEEGLEPSQVLMQYSKQNGFTPSVWMLLYQQERTHLVKTCTAAIKAGVAERRVQIAEQQGQLIVAMMMAFIHDPALGLSSQQMVDAPKLIRKHLLALGAPESDPHSQANQIIETVAIEKGQVI